MPNKKRPFCEATRRRNVQGALWQNINTNDGRAFYNASVTRSYQDANDRWQNETLHLNLDDLPRVIGVLQELERLAYEQMQVDYEARNASEEQQQAPVGAGASEEKF